MGLYDFLLRKKEVLERELFPVREKAFFRLSEEEKMLALKIARESLEQSFRKDKLSISQAVPERFKEQATLDVAYWMKGVLRGSQIVSEKPLHEGLRESALKAAHDPRFKPLAAEELDGVRIEITLMSDARTLLSDQDIENNAIDPSRGYRLVSGHHTGWFLPEVFNVSRFRDLRELLEFLIVQKAGLPKTALDRATIETFEVDDFIESEDQSKALTLVGPITQGAPATESFQEKGRKEDLEACLRNAADQLLRIQEADGNIPPVINPLTGKEHQIDWMRLPFAAHALAVYGKTIGDERYVAAAEKAGKYIRENAYEHPFLSPYAKTLCRVYSAELLLALGRNDEAESTAQEIFQRIDAIRAEPILFLKAASLLLSFGGKSEFSTKALSLFEHVYAGFHELAEKKQAIGLAYFPELITVGLQLHESTGEEKYFDIAVRTRDWYVRQQLPDGSFPDVSGGTFAYTRCAGKIFEVLALRPQENEASILEAFRWIRDMQYDKENMFFIPERHRERVRGGFRHDAFNQEVWIDASAHVLIGGARLLEYLK